MVKSFGNYILPKVFSYSPLTLTLSPQGERGIKERTFGNCYNPFQNLVSGHPERSEGCQPIKNTRFFALLRRTYFVKVEF
jgi:hypothetical protein